jgi:hypothetical protein
VQLIHAILDDAEKSAETDDLIADPDVVWSPELQDEIKKLAAMVMVGCIDKAKNHPFLFASIMLVYWLLPIYLATHLHM